jgi:hypothetical protein
MHPPCDPSHQCVVRNPVKETIQVQIDTPHRVISDELARPLDRFMRRAPRPETEAMGMEIRVKDRREHLHDGLADQPIHHRRYPQHPRPTRRLRDHHPPHRPRPIGTRVQHRADLRPMVLQPWPQFLCTHPVDASSTGVTLDTSERQGKILTGQELLPQTHHGGVSGGVTRRRVDAALWRSVFGIHPSTPQSRPLAGLAAVNAPTTSRNVLPLSFAFGPSRRPTIPPVLRPLLTSPQRATTFRPSPSHTTRRTRKARSGIPEHPRRPPWIRPATFLAHPPRLRDSP